MEGKFWEFEFRKSIFLELNIFGNYWENCGWLRKSVYRTSVSSVNSYWCCNWFYLGGWQVYPSEEDSTDAAIIGCHCEWTLVLNAMHAIKYYFRLTSTCEFIFLRYSWELYLAALSISILWGGMCFLVPYLYHHTWSLFTIAS